MRILFIALLLLAVIVLVQGGGGKDKKGKKWIKPKPKPKGSSSSSSHKGQGKHSSSSSHSGSSSSSSHKGKGSSSSTKSSSSSSGSSGSSSSSSDAYAYHHHHHYHPRCCDPCKMLKNPHSRYYKRCGRYLTAAQAMQNQKYCMAAKGDKKKLEKVMASFRDQCYKMFAVIIDYECPPRHEDKMSWDKCDKESYDDWKSVCHEGYCPPEPDHCDECHALTDEHSHFYKTCGHGISKGLLKVWFMSCKASHDWCRWKTLHAMIIGHCHNINPDVIPDFCSTTGLCVDEPAKDDNAIEACSWILDTDSIYYDCMSRFDLERVKKLYMMCVEIYCKKGKTGVCDFSVNVAEICEEKFDIIVYGELDMCEPPTPPTTTPAPTTLSDECAYDGGTLPFGSVDVVLADCTKLCNCTTPRAIECSPIKCDDHAICLTDSDGNQKCNCTDDYEGDGYICFPPPIKECLGQEVDLVMVIDTSASISSGDFAKMQEFVKQVIIRTDIGENSTRVGIIAFSNAAEEVTFLGEINSKIPLVARAATIVHRKQLTYTDKGIVMAEDMFTTYGRPDAKKVLIIATDGRSTEPEETIRAMHSFRSAHINATILAVAVLNSGDVDIGEIRALASGRFDENVLTVEDFDVLLTEVDKLANETCRNETKDAIPDVEIDTENNDNPVPVPKDCMEIVYHDPDYSRWFTYYGVYDIVLGQGLCNGHFVYAHTSYKFYLQWDGTRWEISGKICRFDAFAQPRTGLVYGAPSGGKVHVISETSDTWEEPPDRTPPQSPDYTDSITECY